MSASVENKTLIGFGSALIVLLAIGVTAYWNINRLNSTMGSVAHAHEVMMTLEGALHELTSAESAARGYAFSRDKAIRLDYDTAATRIDRLVRTLRAQTADDARQQQGLDALEPLIASRLAVSRSLLAAADRAGHPTAATLVVTAHGRDLMTEVRGLISQMEAEELANLRRRYARAEAGTRTTLLVIVFGGLCALAFSGLAFALIRRDMRLRRSMEGALRATEQQLQAILDNTTAVIYLKDLQGRYILVNHSFEALARLDRAQIVGRTNHDFLPKDMAEEYDAYDREVLAASGPMTFEQIAPIGGEVRTYISTKCTLRDGQGVPYAMCGVSTDITERKHAEEEMKRLRVFLDSIIENIPAMVFVKDAQDLRFVRFNRAGEELLGLSREELIGKNDHDLFPAEQAAAFTQEDRRTLSGRALVDVPEERITTRDKGVRVLHTQKVPILDHDGVPQYLLGISEDITEQRQWEQQRENLDEKLRRRSEELETANKELEAFSYSVSHDLRAPLRHIGGFADLLLRAEASQMNEAGQRRLQVIVESARRMGQLIDDLLVFSRMGRTELQHSQVDLGAMVRSVLDEFEEDVRGRCIRWKIGRLPEVEGDPAMLRLVISNLLSNAIKYTGTRTEPEIEIGSMPDVDGGTVVFVKDDGVGFDMQYAGKLFGVFQRLHRPEDFPGTGIGLANVRRIVHRHGGRTWAEGAVDKGATLYFSLPVRQKEERAWAA